MEKLVAHFHLPGLFEFYDFYKMFLPIFYKNRQWFYDWCDISSIYGAPADCVWGGGRVGFGYDRADDVISLMKEFGISARLTFSNSLLKEEHLSDKKCNHLCEMLGDRSGANGVIVFSDLLVEYLKKNYPDLYLVSTTTKVITDAEDLLNELNREDFKYVVPDFRFNNRIDFFQGLSSEQKDKIELLCNECCSVGCRNRKTCYESVSKKALGIEEDEHICTSPDASEGYVFSKAMKSPAFVGINEICNTFLPMGISNFKIEGRSLGSALLLEFILYYMTKPEYHLQVREKLYLDHSLDLF